MNVHIQRIWYGPMITVCLLACCMAIVLLILHIPFIFLGMYKAGQRVRIAAMWLNREAKREFRRLPKSVSQPPPG